MGSLCCRTGRASRPPGRLGGITASILSLSIVLFLPKCPLCLAAWLTVATGLSFPASGAEWVRWNLLSLPFVALAVWIARRAAPSIRRLRQRALS